MLLLDQSQLNVWLPPVHNAPALWRQHLQRKQPVSALRAMAMRRPFCSLAVVPQLGAYPLRMCLHQAGLMCYKQ